MAFMAIPSSKPRLTLLVAGKPIFFLIDTGITYSALMEYASSTCPSQVSTDGVDVLISKPLATPSLNCLLLGTPFSHPFLVLPKCPTQVLGKDILSKFRASLMLLSSTSNSDPSFLLLTKPKVDKFLFQTSLVTSKFHIKLKDPSIYPC